MASSDIIKIGFDYRSSLAQFEKDTNGVFDGISSKAGKQKITIQLDAKDDKVIDKIKELQKLKLDKFTFEFGNSGLKEQLQTFDKLENKINEIINLSKGIGNSSAPIVDVNKSSKEIDKLENKISELNKKYDELQKKSATGGISGKEVNLVDNDEFKKLSQEVSELKDQFDDLKTHMSLLDDYTVPTDRFFELQTQVEATSVKVSNLVDEMTRLSNVQKNIGVETNISSASTESVTNSIKEENNVLEQNTQKVKENTQAKEQNANVNLNKYDKRLDSYNGKIDKYKTTIDRFNDGGWTSSTYLENVQAVKNAVKEYETLLNELKGKDASLVTSDDINRLDNYEKKIKDTIATVTNMSASEKGYNFVSGQKELDKIHKLLNENSKMSSEAKAKIKAYYAEIESGNPSMSLDKIHGEILKIYNAEVEAGRAGRTLFDTLKNSGFHQIAAQMAGMVGVYDVINVIKQAASTVTELNTQITELAKVSEQSSKQIYADFDSYADIAKEVRGTISDTIAATADWSKNGYSIPDAKQLAEISQLYKNVGDGIDIDTANESLISTLKGFQLEADQAEHIVDVFNEVSNNEAISSGGIGEALQRSAASFNAASTSLEKSVSLVTATNSVLQNPEKVGNMWRTVSARLRGSETELKEMGEDTDGLVTSTSKLQALVKGITGFDIMKDKDTYKDIYDIVLGIGEKWKDLSDIDRASLLEALAGKQQSNALAAALSNIDILKKSYEEATHAEGSAREENEEYSKSIRASIDLAQAKLEQLANDTLNSNFLKGAIDAGGKLIEVLDGIVKSGNAIPTLLAAIGAGLSFKNIGKCYVSA
jgi:TP901 family phage tail tape measure protein|uniref:Minor tail protein n=1 Tax=Siphoviridae sp. ctPJC19 TaxID=2826321 RepID=A0A8S5M550_9CAUD|nr:MAG TPA: minor tail protein [Siphoviridae sp. ctPJC19]